MDYTFYIEVSVVNVITSQLLDFVKIVPNNEGISEALPFIEPDTSITTNVSPSNLRNITNR